MPGAPSGRATRNAMPRPSRRSAAKWRRRSPRLWRSSRRGSIDQIASPRASMTARDVSPTSSKRRAASLPSGTAAVPDLREDRDPREAGADVVVEVRRQARPDAFDGHGAPKALPVDHGSGQDCARPGQNEKPGSAPDGGLDDDAHGRRLSGLPAGSGRPYGKPVAPRGEAHEADGRIGSRRAPAAVDPFEPRLETDSPARREGGRREIDPKARLVRGEDDLGKLRGAQLGHRPRHSRSRGRT